MRRVKKTYDAIYIFKDKEGNLRTINVHSDVKPSERDKIAQSGYMNVKDDMSKWKVIAILEEDSEDEILCKQIKTILKKKPNLKAKLSTSLKSKSKAKSQKSRRSKK